jgi:DNA-binding beta-propeller fold protein YncE
MGLVHSNSLPGDWQISAGIEWMRTSRVEEKEGSLNKTIVAFAVFASLTGLCAQEPQGSVPQLEATIPLPDVKGSFDHFAADVKGKRLFLAAEDHKSVEVFDLASEKHLRSIGGFDTPHAILYVPATNSLLVTDSGPEDSKEGYVRVVSCDTYAITKSIKVLAAADSSGYDPATHLMYVDTGGLEAKMNATVISVIDSEAAKVVNEIKVDSGRVEAITFEQNGSRMFANLRTKGEIGVFDKKTYKLLSTWPISDAKENVPMALDQANHRLFVVCRKPGQFVAFDTETGKEVASLPMPGRADDMSYNPATKDIYVSAGDGVLVVLAQKDPDHYEQAASITTGPQAKISLFVPELKRLYVAVSAAGADPAKVLVFKVD